MKNCLHCAAYRAYWPFIESTIYCFLGFKIIGESERPTECKKKPHSRREMYALKRKLETACVPVKESKPSMLTKGLPFTLRIDLREQSEK